MVGSRHMLNHLVTKVTMLSISIIDVSLYMIYAQFYKPIQLQSHVDAHQSRALYHGQAPSILTLSDGAWDSVTPIEKQKLSVNLGSQIWSRQWYVSCLPMKCLTGA